MNRSLLAQRLRGAMRRELWLSIALPTALVIAAFAVASHFVEPPPPRTLTLAVAQDEGGARFYAKKYQSVLAKQGITLKVRATAGTTENLRLLNTQTSGADVAFVQGGVPDVQKTGRIVSLGSVAYVPLWVFYRGENIDDPGALRGRRLGVGAPDSATRDLALHILKLCGAQDPPTQLVSVERAAGIEQLKAGQIDALFVVAPAESPALQKLAASPGVHLLSFARAEAYTRRLPFLSRLVLPRGVFDLVADVPDHDVALLAPTANLVARDDLHPALAYLLLQAASEIHGSAGLLDKTGEFPAPLETGFPLADQARRYFQTGVPLAQRYLPFWAASLADRLWVLLLPVIAVLVPLLRLVPPLYRWRVRSRIYRWYARLKEVELELDEGPSRESLDAMLVRLDEIETAVNHIPTPLAYAENLYFFREHVDLLRRRIGQRLGVASGDELGERKTG